MKEPFIRKSFNLEDSDVESVHSKTIDWFKKNKAKIVEDKPHSIRASHEKLRTWIFTRSYHRTYRQHICPLYWRKEIIINFNRTKNGVDVMISIFLTNEVHLLDHIRKRWWNLLVLDYMDHMEIDCSEFKRSFYTEETRGKMIRDILTSPIISYPILVLIAALFFTMVPGGVVMSIGFLPYLLSHLIPMSISINKVSKLTSS